MINTEYNYTVYFSTQDENEDDDTFLKFDDVVRAGIRAMGLEGKMKLLETDMIDNYPAEEILDDCD